MARARKIFPLHFTKRYFLFLTLVIILSSVILSFIVLQSFTESIKDRVGKELFAVALQLEINLPISYNEILKQHNAVGKPVPDQIKVLNSALQPIIQQLSYSHPDVGMGYYNKELNHQLAKTSFTPPSLINLFHKNYPNFSFYETGTPDLLYQLNSTALEAPVLYQTYPIYRDGKLIGHTWASIKMQHIYSSVLRGATNIVLSGILTLVIIIGFSWYVFYMLGGDLKQFALAVKNDDLNASIALLPELEPLVKLVREQKKTLAKNHQQLQQLAFIVESSEDAIIGTDLDGVITSWNAGAEKIYGYTAQEAIGRLVNIIIPNDKEEEFSKLLAKIRSGESVKHLDTARVKKDGTLINVSITVSPIKDASGELVGASTMARDITESKKYELEMVRLDRLNLVGQMAAGISHEIRNPMTTVRGFLQLLREKDNSSQYANHYTLMIEELDQANSIITEFLSLAKNKPSELKKQNLKTLIERIKPLIESDAIKSGINVFLHLDNVPDFSFNEKEIRQLIFNLVRNAFEAAEQGGNVDISIYAKAGKVVLAVQDDGPGIEPELIDKIGNPFFTTKDYGTGLGLAVCYNTATRHHAQIDIDTGPTGTTFSVRFAHINP